MELHIFVVFVLGAFALVASPGTDFIYVLSRSISDGRNAGFVAALGVSSGMLVHTGFAVAGLTALLYSSAIAFLIAKYIGVFYLVYLGVKIFLTKDQFKNMEVAESANNYDIFKHGLLTNVLNPKVGLTFMAYMPQFLSPAGESSLLVLQLGISICIVALIWFSIVGFFSSAVRRYVVESEAIGNTTRYATSSILVFLGFRLAWLERE